MKKATVFTTGAAAKATAMEAMAEGMIAVAMKVAKAWWVVHVFEGGTLAEGGTFKFAL